jgi:hypothetical protein
MRKLSIIFSVISVLVSSNSYCQTLINQIETNSKYMQDTKYVIDIMLPPEYDSTHIYPVVYCVDNWLGSKFVPGMLYLLNFSQAIEPLIIAGIGNEGNIHDWQMERTRDLTPTHVSKNDMNSSSSPGNRGITGGADNFLLFIKNELILKGFADLRDLLEEKNISSPKLTSHIFSGEDHRSAIIPAYYEAFKCLYGKN